MNISPALGRAVEDGDLAGVRQLLDDFVADDPGLVNRPDAAGATPLQLAVLRIWGRNGAEIVDLLLAHGATIDDYSACVLGRAAALSSLLRTPGEVTPSRLARLMGGAQEAGHAHVARILVEAGADLDVFGAASFGPIAALEQALAQEPGVVGSHRPVGRYQPLHCAAETGQLHHVERLLAHGADPGGRNAWGFTPLHLSVLGARGYPTTEGHLHITRLLLERGAEIDAADDLQRTPLDLAVHGAQHKRWSSPSMEMWRRINPEGLAGIDGDRAGELLALLRSRGARTGAGATR